MFYITVSHSGPPGGADHDRLGLHACDRVSWTPAWLLRMTMKYANFFECLIGWFARVVGDGPGFTSDPPLRRHPHPIAWVRVHPSNHQLYRKIRFCVHSTNTAVNE